MVFVMSENTDIREKEINADDLVVSAEYSGEAMFEELLSIAESFKDNDIKAIVTALLREHKEKLVFWPAAFKLHHAIRGGLMLHTLSIVRLCEKVCELYTFVDKEVEKLGLEKNLRNGGKSCAALFFKRQNRISDLGLCNERNRFLQIRFFRLQLCDILYRKSYFAESKNILDLQKFFYFLICRYLT